MAQLCTLKGKDGVVFSQSNKSGDVSLAVQLAYSGYTLPDLYNCVLSRASYTLQTFMSHDNLCLGEPRQSRIPGNVKEN